MKNMVLPLVIILLIAELAILSSAMAAPSSDIQRKVFVHYAKPVKPTPPTKDPSGAYTTFAHWNLQDLPVVYKINTAGGGLSSSFVTSTIDTAGEEWDDGDVSDWGGVSRELFTYNGLSTKTYADLETMDDENTIVFGNYPDGNVIAVTFVWYSRAGKQIKEFDMMLDTDYTWGDATANSAVMDLQNIATHELGHAVGLGDLYRPNTNLETMYGYATEGQTIKRTLYYGDIAGITSLYG